MSNFTSAKSNVKLKRWVKRIIIGLILLISFIIGVDLYVEHTTKPYIYSNTNNIPKYKVGLLLGTSKYVGNNRINLFYKYRIDAAVALFKSGKINYILISGDNGHHAYNEPETMRDDLINAGIPEERLVLDYAGFRTLDSVIRAHHVFGLNEFTIISQRFHNERAVYIARQYGLNVNAYNAQDVNIRSGNKVLIREKLARTKMVFDLLIGKEPKFYGPKINIG